MPILFSYSPIFRFLYILDDASPAGLEYMLRNLPHSSEPHGVIVTSTCISPSQLWDFAASFQQRVDPKSMRPSVQSIRLQNYDDDVVIRVANAIGLPCGDDEVVRALHETCIYTAHVPITVVMLFRFFRRKQIQMTASSHSHSSSTSKAVVRSITEWRDIAESLDESEHRGLQAAVRLVLKELRELHDRDLMIDCFIILGMLMHCPTFTSQHFFIQHFAPDSPFFFTNPDPLQSYPPKDVGAELCSDVERGFRAIRTLSELGFVRLLQVKLNNPGDYYFVTIMPHMIQSLLKQELQESGSIYSAINLSNVIPLHVGDLTNDSVYDNQIPSIRRVLSTCEHCLSVILSVSPQLLIWVCGVFLRIARIYQVMDYDPESQRRMLVSFRNTIAKHSDASEVQDLRLRAHLYGGDEFSEQALLDIDAVSNENSSEVMATALNNIGCMFNSDGEYARALQYYHKALSIQLQHFGENFPFVGTMYTNVGIALDHLERHDEALEYFQKALAIRKATLSDTHPQVALSYIDIGQAFSRQGRHTTALEQYNLALSIQVNHYGDRHKLVASTLSFIGCCYDRLAQPLKAIEYQKQVLDIQTSVLPSGSSELSATYNNIASGLSKIGQHGESIKYFTEALNIRKSIHGPRSPELSVMYNNIGSAYHYKCDNKRSLEYFTRALEIDLEHGKTLGAASGFNNIAGCVDSFKKEENQKALDFYTRGLELSAQASWKQASGHCHYVGQHWFGSLQNRYESSA
jgi:tetratricopeptide (TPR) repeat protein